MEYTIPEHRQIQGALLLPAPTLQWTGYFSNFFFEKFAKIQVWLQTPTHAPTVGVPRGILGVVQGNPGPATD